MLDPRKLQRLLKQLELQPIQDVEQVIIRTSDYELIFDHPQVMLTSMAGTSAYQVVGTPKQVPRQRPIPEQDIKLVMEQTGADESAAKRALLESGGDLAAAILSLRRARQ